MKLNRVPLISIGVPVYNGEELLEKTLHSLIAQTYTNIEIIISDNKSTDSTVAIIQKFARKDKRIRFFQQAKNIGELPNFNFVLSKAQGEFFTWHAADDYRDKKNIETLYKLLVDNPDSIGAMCDYNNVYKGKSYFVNKPIEYANDISTIDSIKHFVRTRNIICLFALYKTNVLKKCGGHHTDSRPFFKGSDFLSVLRPLLIGKMVYSPKVLFYKVDTGLFTERYKAIQQSFFSHNTFIKIFRYLLSPVYYLYDLYYSEVYLWKSGVSFSNKLALSIFFFYSWIVNNIKFLLSILKGLLVILIGFLKKI